MNKLRISFLVCILLASLLLFGCTETIPGVPFTAGQFFSKVTDLNYTKFLNGDYNGLYVIVDGNKLSVVDLNGLSGSSDWNALTNFPSGCPSGYAVQIIDSNLTCVMLPQTKLFVAKKFISDYNSVTGFFNSFALAFTDLNSGFPAACPTGSYIYQLAPGVAYCSYPTATIDTNTYTAGIMATDNNRFLIDVNVTSGKGVYANKFADMNSEYVYEADYGTKSLINYDGQALVSGLRVGSAFVALQGRGIRYTYTTPWAKAVMCINSNCKFTQDLNVGDVISISSCAESGTYYDTVATIVSDNNLTVVANNFGATCGNDYTNATAYIKKYPSFRVITSNGSERFKIHPITGSPVFTNSHITLSNGYGIYGTGNTFIDPLSGALSLYGNSVLGIWISSSPAGLTAFPYGTTYWGWDGAGGAVGGVKTEGVIRGSINGGSSNGGGTPLNYQVSALGNNTAMYQKWTIGEPTTSGLGAQTQIQRMKLTYNLFDVNVNTVLSRDNLKLSFGDASDASIYYDGTDLNINPKEVGTGKVNIQGNLSVDGNINNPILNVDIANKRVGIGENIVPTTTLTVFKDGSGDNRVGGDITLARYLNGNDIRGGAIFSYYNSTDAQDQLCFGVSDDTTMPNTIAKTKMVINGIGQVGIGTTNPDYLLDVAGTANFQTTTTFNGGLSIYNGYGASAGTWVQLPEKNGAGIGLGPQGTNVLLGYVNVNDDWYNGTLSGDVVYRNGIGKNIHIGINNATNDNKPSMTFDTNGYVGVGIIKPLTRLDVNGSVKIRTDLNVDGNFFGNNIYGGDWNKLDGGFETVDLVTANVYVRATKLGAGSLNGFSVSDGNLIATYGGMYQITTTSSVTRSGTGGEYGMKGYVNDTGQNNCYSHFHLAVTTPNANPNFTCFVRMVAGDKYNTRFDNHDVSIDDIILESMNTTIVRVGQ